MAYNVIIPTIEVRPSNEFGRPALTINLTLKITNRAHVVPSTSEDQGSGFDIYVTAQDYYHEQGIRSLFRNLKEGRCHIVPVLSMNETAELSNENETIVVYDHLPEYVQQIIREEFTDVFQGAIDNHLGVAGVRNNFTIVE